MNNVETLQKIREHISDHNSWIKYYSAVNYKGQSVDPTKEDACKWCLSGAVDYVKFHYKIPNDQMQSVSDILNDVKVLGNQSISQDIDGNAFLHFAEFNDDFNITHSDVLNLLDTAIDYAFVAS